VGVSGACEMVVSYLKILNNFLFQVRHPLLFSIINIICTGRFIMYSGITKIYYRKTVAHVFTKPVQIERTTQKFLSQ
jgi:hypothetical protein